MPKRLSKFEIACMEKEAQRGAAWGAYGAYVRQNNLDKKCSDLRRKLKLSGQGLSRAEIEEKVKELISQKSTGGLYIG